MIIQSTIRIQTNLRSSRSLLKVCFLKNLRHKNYDAFSAFVFFIGAFETSSSTMALCLYELSKDQSLQQKVQNEIDKVLEKRKKIDFDMMSDLKYLECCIDETLRKYPPAPFLIRECGKSYHIPDSNLVVEKGTPLIISTFGLHRDPDYFPNPETFDPERFIEGNIDKIQPFTYLPFGKT
jgi:cytochrome P450 family 6